MKKGALGIPGLVATGAYLGGKKLVNTEDPQSFEIGEPLPPITAGEDDTNQNQYRSYLGVSTEGKKFGDMFDESEITDDIRQRFSNKYFPDDYRIPQLRGRPRLRIKNNAGVTMTGAKPEILAIAEKTAFDIGKQLTLNSAFRSQKSHAAAYAGTGKRPPKGSKHLIGEALDVRVREFNNKEKAEFVEAVIRHGAQALGFYGGRFIHMDLGPKRTWSKIPSYAKYALRYG